MVDRGMELLLADNSDPGPSRIVLVDRGRPVPLMLVVLVERPRNGS